MKQQRQKFIKQSFQKIGVTRWPQDPNAITQGPYVLQASVRTSVKSNIAWATDDGSDAKVAESWPDFFRDGSLDDWQLFYFSMFLFVKNPA